MGAARGSTGQRRARPRTLPSRVSAGPMGGVGCLPGQRFPTPPDFLHDLSRRARRRQLLTQEAPRQASAATFRWTSTSRLPHTKSLSLSCLNLPIYLRGFGWGDPMAAVGTSATLARCGHAQAPRSSGCFRCFGLLHVASARPTQTRDGESRRPLPDSLAGEGPAGQEDPGSDFQAADPLPLPRAGPC